MKNKSGHEFVPTLTIYAVKFVYKPSKPKRRQANPQSQRVAQREDLTTLYTHNLHGAKLVVFQA